MRSRFTSSLYLALLAVGALSSGCKKSKANATPGATIPTPVAHAAYVTNNGSDSLSVIDRDGTAVTTVPVDVDPDEKEAPHHLAVDAKARTAFVALSFPAPPKKTKDPHGNHGNAESHGQLARLDLERLAVKDLADLDYNPGDILLTHDRRRVIVTHFDMRRAMTVAAKGGATGTMFASLQLWDAASGKQVGSRPVCVAPHGTITTPDDRLALVACYGSDEIAVVDLTSPSLPTARYPLGVAQGVPGAPTYGPYSVELAPDGRRVVVASLEASDVRVFDLVDRKFLPELTVSLRARAFFPTFVDADRVLVPTQGPDGLVRVNIATSTIEARAPWGGDVCKAPHVAKAARDKRVYVVCEGDHTAPGHVIEVDPASLAVKRRWEVGVYPDGIDFGE
jgi:DNA-binding beta-propeller fold protein YncE